MLLADSHPDRDDPAEVREDDIDLALVKAGLGVDVVPDDPDAILSEADQDLDAADVEFDIVKSSRPITDGEIDIE